MLTSFMGFIYKALYERASPMVRVVLRSLLGSDSQQSVVIRTGWSVQRIQRVGEQSLQLGEICCSYTPLSHRPSRPAWARVCCVQVGWSQVVRLSLRPLNDLTGGREHWQDQQNYQRVQGQGYAQHQGPHTLQAATPTRSHAGKERQNPVTYI